MTQCNLNNVYKEWFSTKNLNNYFFTTTSYRFDHLFSGLKESNITFVTYIPFYQMIIQSQRKWGLVRISL